eukprot:2034820-Pleurochrysis_carterae.AAC.3
MELALRTSVFWAWRQASSLCGLESMATQCSEIEGHIFFARLTPLQRLCMYADGSWLSGFKSILIRPDIDVPGYSW